MDSPTITSYATTVWIREKRAAHNVCAALLVVAEAVTSAFQHVGSHHCKGDTDAGISVGYHQASDRPGRILGDHAQACPDLQSIK